MFNASFYKNKKVLVTGHTGFKGSWMCKVLTELGADVTGYSLEPPTNPNLYSQSENDKEIKSVIGDIRDYDRLKSVFEETKPEIVFHLAAQPIVRESYRNPRYTYETNVMGTVNVMECVRLTLSVKSVLNVTTDKVYKNNEWFWGYREDEPLDGFDPYSNSKSCSELVTHSYINSFFAQRDIAVSTARAGNVIGGGDYAGDRIIPDCVRAAMAGKKIIVRNPYSTRPYQHVLEPIMAYLMIAAKQYDDRSKAGSYNVGPDERDCITTGNLVDMFCSTWQNGMSWENQSDGEEFHEANFLKLDCSKIKTAFGWRPVWDINKCMEMTCRFNKKLINKENISEEMKKEINEYMEDLHVKLEH